MLGAEEEGRGVAAVEQLLPLQVRRLLQHGRVRELHHDVGAEHLGQQLGLRSQGGEVRGGEVRRWRTWAGGPIDRGVAEAWGRKGQEQEQRKAETPVHHVLGSQTTTDSLQSLNKLPGWNVASDSTLGTNWVILSCEMRSKLHLTGERMIDSRQTPTTTPEQACIRWGPWLGLVDFTLHGPTAMKTNAIPERSTWHILRQLLEIKASVDWPKH